MFTPNTPYVAPFGNSPFVNNPYISSQLAHQPPNRVEQPRELSLPRVVNYLAK